MAKVRTGLWIEILDYDQATTPPLIGCPARMVDADGKEIEPEYIATIPTRRLIRIEDLLIYVQAAAAKASRTALEPAPEPGQLTGARISFEGLYKPE